MPGINHACQLEPLSNEDSWRLFHYEELEGRGDCVQTMLERIGREILKKCEGLPHAVKVVGGVLRGLETKEQSCFAFSSLYPRQRLISKNELKISWVRNCFLKNDRMNMMLQLADGYFRELSSRTYLQAAVDKNNAYYVPKMAHDLFRFFAGEEYLTVEMPNGISLKTRHLFLDYKVNRVLFGAASPFQENSHIGQLRTLRLLDKMPFSGGLSNLVRSLASLTLFDLGKVGIRALPKAVKNMKHLRHLILSHNPITELLTSVASLCSLEILDLIGCSSLKELPQKINQMSSLRYLELGGTHKIRSLPEGIGGTHYTGKDVDPFDQAYKSFDFTERIEAAFENLQPCKTLAKLAVEHYDGKKFPSWMTYPWLSNLVELLYMEGIDKVKCIGKEFYGSVKLENAFPKLETLNVHEFLNLEEWLEVDGVMRFLGSVNVSNIPRLKRLSWLPCQSSSHLVNIEFMEALPAFVKLPFLEFLSISHWNQMHKQGILWKLWKSSGCSISQVESCSSLALFGGMGKS
ncbi:putative disease resistance RPP13-like protein 1 [Nymphaea colorata]|nr:putative disease resistance RPP13-like protein 1 [Nymphaea colorata]